MIRPFVVALAFAVMAALPIAAQETRPFTHDAGTTEIPVAPKRIVALHDVGLTIPLLELGITPVASSGRMRADGSIYLRSGMSLVGIDFDNSDITYVDDEDHHNQLHRRGIAAPVQSHRPHHHARPL